MESALNVQARVVFAIMMREIHTIHGKTKLGYLWALIQSMWMVFAFWGIRYLADASAPHGMHILMFLMVGFSSFYIFQNTVSKCMSAVNGNRALLTYPQVTPLDIMVARTIVLWATEVVAALLLTAGGALFGMPVMITDVGGFLGVLLLTPILGLGVGVLCASLEVFYPTLEKIVPMVMRILFFTSGLFFCATSLPSYALKYLWFNPMLQLIDWGRQCLSRGYTTIDYSVTYIVSFALVSLCLGLLLERHARGRLL